MINHAFSQKLCIIANAYSAYNAGLATTSQKYMFNLFVETEGYKSPKILTITPDDAYTIGLGYMCVAVAFDNGNVVINEIAAENALYCFIKSYVENRNVEVLPFIFSLFNKYADLLDDTIERVLKETLYYGMDFYNYKIDGYKFYRLSIMAFCKERFPQKLEDKIFVPRRNDIKQYVKEFGDSSLSTISNINEIGYQNMVKLYQSITNFLTDF